MIGSGSRQSLRDRRLTLQYTAKPDSGLPIRWFLSKHAMLSLRFNVDRGLLVLCGVSP